MSLTTDLEKQLSGIKISIFVVVVNDFWPVCKCSAGFSVVTYF